MYSDRNRKSGVRCRQRARMAYRAVATYTGKHVLNAWWNFDCKHEILKLALGSPLSALTVCCGLDNEKLMKSFLCYPCPGDKEAIRPIIFERSLAIVKILSPDYISKCIIIFLLFCKTLLVLITWINIFFTFQYKWLQMRLIYLCNYFIDKISYYITYLLVIKY